MGREENWPAVELDGEEGGREGETGSSCRRRVGVVWKEVDLRVSLRAVPWAAAGQSAMGGHVDRQLTLSLSSLFLFLSLPRCSTYPLLSSLHSQLPASMTTCLGCQHTELSNQPETTS